MNIKRRSLVALALDDDIYTIGGRSSETTYLSSMEKFDSQTRSWSSMARMDDKRTGHCGAVLNGFLYVVGGHNGTTALPTAERFSVAGGEWEILPEMDKARINAAACPFTITNQQNGKQASSVFVFGGSSLSSVERFNVGVNEQGALCGPGDPPGVWATTNPMPITRYRHIAVPNVRNDSIYVIGGYDGTNYLATVDRFQVKSRTWFADSKVKPMSRSRCDLAGFSVDYHFE